MADFEDLAGTSAEQRPRPEGPAPPDDSRKPYAAEIAVAWRNFFQPVYNGLLQPNDDTLATRGGGLGLRIYDELERDANCYAMMQKRKMALIAREWNVEPGGPRLADKKAAALVTEQLEAMQFDRVCIELLDAILKGYAVSEILWDVSGGHVRATDCVARDQRRFKFAADYSLRLLTLDDPMFGIPLPERKFIVHSFGAKDRNPYGLGLGSRLFWPVFFKRNGLQFWLTFLDKYGSPTAVGTYPQGSSPTARAALLSALQAIAQEAQIALPQGMDVKLLEAARSANSGYKELMVYLDEEMAKCCLGETLTTSTSEAKGSLAASRTHNQVRLEVVAADADLLSGTLNNTLIRWISEYNFPNAVPPRIWWDVSESLDLYQRAQADALVFQMGFKPTLDYIRDTYGEGWDESPNGPPKSAPPGQSVITPSGPIPGSKITPDATTDPGAMLSEGTPQTTPDAVDQLTNAISRAAADPLSNWIDRIRALVNRAQSLEQLRDLLLNAYGDLPPDELTKVMQAGFAVADLSGRYDVDDAH